MLRLIWLLGWLRPRTALRRLLVLVAVVVAGGSLLLGPAAFAEGVLRHGREAATAVLDAVAGAVPAVRGGQEARMLGVVDGDTADVSMPVDGRRREVRIRLVGIDTPESKKPGTPVECGALQAEHRLLELTFTAPRDTDGDGLYDVEGGRGRRVTFAEDSRSDAVDRYGRRLGYLTVRGRERTVQEQLLASGWADVYVHRGREFDRLGDFEAAAEIAEAGRRGVHASCGGDFHSAG